MTWKGIPKLVLKFAKNDSKTCPKNNIVFTNFVGSILAPKCECELNVRLQVGLPVSVVFFDKILRILYVFIHFGDMPHYTFLCSNWYTTCPNLTNPICFHTFGGDIIFHVFFPQTKRSDVGFLLSFLQNYICWSGFLVVAYLPRLA